MRDSLDYGKVSAEVKQLHENESKLRQENMQLKVSQIDLFKPYEFLHKKSFFHN